MWLAVQAAAGADPTTIVAGLLALASAVFVAVIGIRGTFKTADSARETAFDKRVDDALERAQQRLEAMTTDRDKYRELYAELRMAVRAKGYDPDDIVSKGATSGQS